MGKTTEFDLSGVVKSEVLKANNTDKSYILFNRYLLLYVLDTKLRPEDKMTNQQDENCFLMKIINPSLSYICFICYDKLLNTCDIRIYSYLCTHVCMCVYIHISVYIHAHNFKTKIKTTKRLIVVIYIYFFHFNCFFVVIYWIFV